jgi:hypothetical protein
LKSLLAVFLILSLSFFACSASNSHTLLRNSTQFPLTFNVCIDHKFSEFERKQIRAAVREWDNALGSSIKINHYMVSELIGGFCRVTIYRNTKDSPAFKRKPNAIGVANSIGGNKIWIAADKQLWWDEKKNKHYILRETVAHELGHIFWLDHTVGGLMNPKIIPGSTVSKRNANHAAFMLSIEISAVIIVNVSPILYSCIPY